MAAGGDTQQIRTILPQVQLRGYLSAERCCSPIVPPEGHAASPGAERISNMPCCHCRRGCGAVLEACPQALCGQMLILRLCEKIPWLRSYMRSQRSDALCRSCPRRCRDCEAVLSPEKCCNVAHAGNVSPCRQGKGFRDRPEVPGGAQCAAWHAECQAPLSVPHHRHHRVIFHP